MFAKKEDWCNKLSSTELLRLRLRSPMSDTEPGPIPNNSSLTGEAGRASCCKCPSRTGASGLNTEQLFRNWARRASRAAASRQLGSSAERTIAEICQFDLELRLTGPGTQSEQLFVCPDFPVSKTNNHSAARISQFAARTKKPELEALAFVRSFTSFLSNDK